MSDYIEREPVAIFVEECGCSPTWIAKRIRNHEAFPAADVAPVRHGRWIRPHWRNSVSCADCSECGAEAHHVEYRGVQKYYKRCPACGALMDEEDEST